MEYSKLHMFIASCILLQVFVNVAVGSVETTSYAIDKLNTNIDSVILQRLEQLEKRESENKQMIDAMKTELRYAEEKEKTQETQLMAMHYRLNAVEKENKELIRKASENIESLAHAYENRESKRNKRGAPQPVTASPLLVAFYAQRISKLTHLGSNRALVFEHAVTNVGKRYSSSNGYFTAPVDGVYVFSATIMTSRSNHSYAGFAINGNIITTVMLNEEMRDSTCQQIIVELKHGDNVSIRNMIQNTDYEGGEQSVFSGFLLRETTPTLAAGKRNSI